MNLVKNGSKIIVGINDGVIVYDLENQRDQHVKVPDPILPENSTKEQIQSSNELKNITSIEFSKLGDYLVVATENKQVIVYDKDFHIKKNLIVNRAPSKVCFTNTNDILVADKTGDVYLYKLSTEDHPSLLLGHRSVILDIIVSDCGKYIITCDRDEKIRVSCFPNCYNIVSFCLGHKEFVTKVNLKENILISASGDGTIRLWNYIKGEQLSVINTNKYIDEKKLLTKFAEEMDKEKVDVVALPITDLQTYKVDKLYIAVSIYSYEGIQLYTTDLLSFKSNFIAKINVNNSFRFCLNTDLYILNTNLSIYRMVDDNFVQMDDPYLNKFYDKYKNMFKLDKSNLDISVLYKRKFDNVKEYLERKRQRLEGK